MLWLLTMRSFFWRLLLSVFLFGAFAVSSSPIACNDPISCALASIIVPLPNVTQSGFTIYNFRCFNLAIASLPSTYTYPTKVSFGLHEGSLECSGSYTYAIPTTPHGSLDLGISPLTVDISVDVSTNDVLPQAITTTCSVAQPIVQVLDVTGSLKPAILDALVAILQKTLDTVLTKVFCDGIANFLQVNGTQALQDTIDPALQQIIDAGQPTAQSSSALVSTSAATADWVKWNHLFSSSLSSAPLVDLSCMRKTAPEVMVSIQRPLIDQLVNYLTGGTGIFNIPVNKAITLGKDTLTLNSVILTGLNSFTEISLFEPSDTDDYTINSKLGIQTLGLTLNVTFAIPPSVSFPYPYVEWLLLEAETKNTSFAMETVVGVSHEALTQLYISQLTDPSCLLTAVDMIEITSLQLFTSIDKLTVTQVHGGAMQLEQDIVSLIDNVLSLVFTGYSTLVSELIPGLTQSVIRPSLNQKIANRIATTVCVDNCPKDEEYVVWYNTTVIKVIDFVVNDLLGPAGLNKVIRCATGGTGSISTGNDKVLVKVGGLDSFSYLSILEPYSPKEVKFKPYNLLNRITLGACSGRNCHPLTITMSKNASGSGSGSGSGSSVGMSEDMTQMLPVPVQGFLNGNLSGPVTFEFSNLLLYADLMLGVSKGMLCHLHLAALSTDGCVTSTVQMLGLSTLQMSTQSAAMKISSTVHDITDKTNAFLKNLGSASGLQKINSHLQANVDSANATCLGLAVDSGSPTAGSNINTTTGPTVNYWLVPVITTVSIFFLAGLYHFFIRVPYILNQPDSLTKGVEPIADDAAAAEGTGRLSQLYFFLITRRWREAMLFNENLNFFLRVYLVTALSVIFVMLRLGLKDLDLLTVMIEIVSASKTQTAVVTYENNYVDLWGFGAYTTQIVGDVAMVWCFFAVLLTILCMLLPPDLLSVKKREGWMLFAMFTAKITNFNYYFSIFFSFLLYFTVVVPPANLTVNLYVQLEEGFTIGTLVFWWYLITFQMAVSCHRYLVSLETSSNQLDAKRLDNMSVDAAMAPALTFGDASLNPDSATTASQEKDTPETLINHVYTVPAFLLPLSFIPDSLRYCSYKHPTSVQLTSFGKSIVFASSCLVFAFLFAGIYINTFTYEWVGLVSLAITSNTTTDYSFLSLGEGFPATTGYPDQTDVKFAQAVYLLYSVVLPLVSVIAMATMWFAPMKYITQMYVLTAAEFFMTWAQFDVTVVTLLVLVSTSTFSKYITYEIGSFCDGINNVLVAKFDNILNGNDVCFQANTYFGPNVWVAVVAASFLAVYTVASALTFVIATTERRERLSGLASGGAGDNKLSRASVASNTLREPLIDPGNNNNHNNSVVGGRHDSLAGSHLVTHLQKKSSRGCLRDTIVRALLSGLFYTRMVEVVVSNRETVA